MLEPYILGCPRGCRKNSDQSWSTVFVPQCYYWFSFFPARRFESGVVGNDFDRADDGRSATVRRRLTTCQSADDVVHAAVIVERRNTRTRWRPPHSRIATIIRRITDGVGTRTHSLGKPEPQHFPTSVHRHIHAFHSRPSSSRTLCTLSNSFPLSLNSFSNTHAPHDNDLQHARCRSTSCRLFSIRIYSTRPLSRIVYTPHTSHSLVTKMFYIAWGTQ